MTEHNEATEEQTEVQQKQGQVLPDGIYMTTVVSGIHIAMDGVPLLKMVQTPQESVDYLQSLAASSVLELLAMKAREALMAQKAMGS